MGNLIIYFLTGGLFTTLIVVLEKTGSRLLSGLLALIPVFTLISYIFIGESQGGQAVSDHARFVLWGTVVSWIPYMILVIYLAPRIGSHRAITVGMIAFFVLAIGYIAIVGKYHLL